MKIIIGLAEIALFVSGIIILWGTPWSILALIYLVFMLMYASYRAGKELKK